MCDMNTEECDYSVIDPPNIQRWSQVFETFIPFFTYLFLCFFLGDSSNNRLLLQRASCSIDGYSLGCMAEIQTLCVVSDE